jgi:hypothetical protein
MTKYFTYLALANIVFSGAIFASSCPRCDAANENNLKNPNHYIYYEDYLKANGKKIEKGENEKKETESDIQEKQEKTNDQAPK